MNNFDIILMNPPYGSVGGDTFHLKFVEKSIEIASKTIVVFPFTFVTKTDNKPAAKYKNALDKWLVSVEERPGKEFSGTNMPNVGIYMIDTTKERQDDIIVDTLERKMTISSLFDSLIPSYDKQILRILAGRPLPGTTQGYHHSTVRSLIKKGYIDGEEIDRIIDKEIEAQFKELKDNKFYLMCNNSNGGMNGQFFTSKNGYVLDRGEVEKIALDRKISYVYLEFDTKKAAENCKSAMQRPLLRFTAMMTQDDQHMTYKKCYRYIPNIDWEDERVKTDEGLLEVCGCPKDKAREYALYCKDYIDKVDSNN